MDWEKYYDYVDVEKLFKQDSREKKRKYLDYRKKKY